MPTASKAKLMVELSQTFFDFTAATDAGDHKVFTVSEKSLWSVKDNYEADVRPDGVVTGRNMLSTHATEETVTIAGFTCYLAGVPTTISATTGLAVRPATDVAKIDSITVSSAGEIAVVEGTAAADTTFLTTRGGAGGPPYIPVGSIEIGQVKMNTAASAVLTTSEIFQDVGTHTERSTTPTWEEYPIGDGNKADTTSKTNAYIEFSDEIGDPIHAGDTYKKVYVSGYTPVAAEVSDSVDFKACKYSHSVTSTPYYNSTRGTKSTSLGQGGFSALVDDGITDALVEQEDEKLTFWFYPNRNKLPYSITQGYLGLDPEWGAETDIKVDATISADQKTVNFAS